jgi:hypothetical protein
VGDTPEPPEEFGMIYKDDQMEMMYNWFLARYTDPADEVYHDSKEGGFQFAGNGPYDALEVLSLEFGGKVSESKIQQVAENLTAQCGEWVAIPRSLKP